ncbi:MAG TPA: hypothetical protein VKE74_07790 [Gemmataceae bacterium]|nr:hypothetical protein [Gemmataceae bacterium]
MTRFGRAVVVGIGLGLVVGCAPSNPGGKVADPGKVALEDLGQMLKSLAEQGKRPPTKLAELEPVEPMIPNAGPAIRTGDIVYLWGATYAAGSDKVVAHEKKAPTEGGYVLLQNGSVKTMTADEFRSAPKAK